MGVFKSTSCRRLKPPLCSQQQKARVTQEWKNTHHVIWALRQSTANVKGRKMLPWNVARCSLPLWTGNEVMTLRITLFPLTLLSFLRKPDGDLKDVALSKNYAPFLLLSLLPSFLPLKWNWFKVTSWASLSSLTARQHKEGDTFVHVCVWQPRCTSCPIQLDNCSAFQLSFSQIASLASPQWPPF